MGAGHGHAVHYHGHSLVHRLPAQVKIVALLVFLIAVVLTPREQFWAFGAHLALALTAMLVSRVPLGYYGRRMLIEVPFVVFALALPFVAVGPRVDVLGLSLSEAGLIGAWGLLAKGTLGVMAALVLAASTEPHDIVGGLARLRVPTVLVEIMAFMIRYADVVLDQAERMRIARESRGFQARSLRQWATLGRAAGAMFIRCYERGERVHVAMLSRGYAGRMPIGRETAPTPREVRMAAAIPVLAALVMTAGLAAQGA